MNNDIKEQPITTVICKMSIDKNNTREQFRDAIRSVRDENNQTYIKDHFITITSNQTNYSIDHLKKDIRLINKNINKKLLSKYRLIKNKRHYKLSKDRIVFFCFFEQSKDKLLTHSHMLVRVPLVLKNKIEEITETIKSYLPPFKNKIKKRYKNKNTNRYYSKVTTILEPTKHSCVLSNRSPSIVRKYSTKNMPKDNSENNDNFDVF
jgi:hypothetical protein